MTAEESEPMLLDASLEQRLRAFLWLNHGHDMLYGDDGEMQCQRCMPTWDYWRMPLDEIMSAAERAVWERNLRHTSGQE